MNKNIIIIIVLVIIVLTGGVLFFSNKNNTIDITQNPNNSNNAQQIACTMEAKICPDGSAVGRGGPNCDFDPCPVVSDPHADLIKVSAPLPNSNISSPVKITGVARGYWYFEASFPVKILDANGKVLAIAPAQAKGEWMTTDFVPFELTLPFAKPTTATGTIVLSKDNPSGEPKYDDSISIPVVFQ
ncbi:MAG: Gmad2 immunoglobulin-like domain-containing protein [Candidatus Paceibacterota bacterium]